MVGDLVLIKSVLKYMVLLVLSVLLTISTMIFGALPMRVVRRVYGRAAFWASFLTLALALGVLAMPTYALLLISMTVAVGVYVEMEENGVAVFTAGFVATLASMGAIILGAGIALYQAKASLIETLKEQIAPVVERLAAINANSAITTEVVLQQLPSGLVIALLVAVAIALTGERQLMGWFGLRPLERNTSARLSSFRVPDIFVWLAIFSILGAFYRHDSKVVEILSLNILNVLMVVFFFQGLAVVAHVFRTYRVSPLWRSLWYVILIAQLFLLVSIVGFVDFWMEFRDRLTRKPAETHKGF